MDQISPATSPGMPTSEEPHDILEKLGDLMLPRRSVAFSVALSLTCLVLATGLRFFSNPYLPTGFPFLTYFPAVLVTAVFAGVAAGSVVAVLSGLLAWYFFIPPTGTFGLTSEIGIALGFYSLIMATELVLIAATKQALARLKAANAKSSQLAQSRELMFNELQHRVSNNLATVAALIRMQTGRTIDETARQTLGEAQLRIATISRLQRRLHSPEIQRVEIGAFLRDIASDCIEAAGAGDTEINLDLGHVVVPQEKAVPLGLIISELLMNAVEHGRTGGDPQLDLSLSTVPVPDAADLLRVTIAVRDHGPGVPKGFRVDDSASLGLGIARQFAAQLGAVLTIRNAKGGGAISELIFDTPRAG